MRAAYDLAQDKGFARLTVGEIARKVGMTRSLFYHYFPDRNALADAVLDLIIDSIVDELTSWNTGREEGNID
ncbi:MAG: helix-turn-helix domain-containing protein, partial [Varibaculum cambriense]|nr:helix-turn-helix domain-containing protein [Varibaculum cambriense]